MSGLARVARLCSSGWVRCWLRAAWPFTAPAATLQITVGAGDLECPEIEFSLVSPQAAGIPPATKMYVGAGCQGNCPSINPDGDKLAGAFLDQLPGGYGGEDEQQLRDQIGAIAVAEAKEKGENEFVNREQEDIIDGREYDCDDYQEDVDNLRDEMDELSEQIVENRLEIDKINDEINELKSQKADNPHGDLDNGDIDRRIDDKITILEGRKEDLFEEIDELTEKRFVKQDALKDAETLLKECLAS